MKRELLSQLVDAIDADEDERSEALVLQLTLADEPALGELLQQGNADQRWWAARALAHCGGEQAVPLLLATLQDADAMLRVVAVLALGAIHNRRPAVVAPHLPQLAVLLADEDGTVRQAAADALIQCGDAAVEALVAVLRFGEHEGARSRAAAALRKIGTPATVPALFRCLNDPNYLVHTYAYEALDEMGLLETQLVI
jgi:HEAT repeat protein